MLKVLIIGGSGVLSSAVVDSCLESGFSVTMINRGHRSEFINAKAELIKADIRDEETIRKCLQGRYFDAIIDFLVVSPKSLHHSLQLFGSFGKQYIFISSAQAYNTDSNNVHKEDDNLGQRLWNYSLEKVNCENILVASKVNYTIIRPAVTYDDRRIPYGMCPAIGMHETIIQRVLHNKPIITWNNGQNKTTITHVEDFATLFVPIIANPLAYREVFNICGDEYYTWMEVLEVLGQSLGHAISTIDIPVDFYASYLKGDEKEMLIGGRAKNLVISNKKIKGLIGKELHPKSLYDGLSSVVAYYDKLDRQKTIDYRWDARCDRIINDYCKCKKVNFKQYSKTDWKSNFKNWYAYYGVYYEDKLYIKLLRKLLKWLRK